jgi:hypothetical protein
MSNNFNTFWIKKYTIILVMLLVLISCWTSTEGEQKESTGSISSNEKNLTNSWDADALVNDKDVLIGKEVIDEKIIDNKKSVVDNNISTEKVINEKINADKEIVVDNTSISDSDYIDNYSLLQWKWASSWDKTFVIEFKNSQKIDYYDWKISEKVWFKIFKDFPITDNSKESKYWEYLIVENDDEKFEYRIIKITENILELSYIARWNTVKYERIFDEVK